MATKHYLFQILNNLNMGYLRTQKAKDSLIEASITFYGHYAESYIASSFSTNAQV